MFHLLKSIGYLLILDEEPFNLIEENFSTKNCSREMNSSMVSNLIGTMIKRKLTTQYYRFGILIQEKYKDNQNKILLWTNLKV